MLRTHRTSQISLWKMQSMTSKQYEHMQKGEEAVRQIFCVWRRAKGRDRSREAFFSERRRRLTTAESEPFKV